MRALIDRLTAWAMAWVLAPQRRLRAHRRRDPGPTLIRFQAPGCRRDADLLVGLEVSARLYSIEHGVNVPDGARPALVYYELAMLVLLRVLNGYQVDELIGLPTPAGECRSCALRQMVVAELRSQLGREARRQLVAAAGRAFEVSSV